MGVFKGVLLLFFDLLTNYYCNMLLNNIKVIIFTDIFLSKNMLFLYFVGFPSDFSPFLLLRGHLRFVRPGEEHEAAGRRWVCASFGVEKRRWFVQRVWGQENVEKKHEEQKTGGWWCCSSIFVVPSEAQSVKPVETGSWGRWHGWWDIACVRILEKSSWFHPWWVKWHGLHCGKVLEWLRGLFCW